MKKICTVILVIVLGFFVVGCDKVIPKTEYGINEEAVLDDIKIELVKATKIENDILEVVFEITNERNNSITLSPDNNFKLYDINQVQIPNLYEANKNIIKKDETINYTLQYNTQKDLYEILFYSGIVENNIKFTITSLDID